MVKGTHRGNVKDDGGAVGARATPRRQPPDGVGKRWRQSPSLTPRRGRRQSPSAIALFLSKKGKGKHVRREAAGLPRARRVSNATRCNRLGNVALTLGELRRITKDFSDDQLIGEGAFGKVYKGVLTNGDMVAVKRFASTITGLQDFQYENEAQHLMRLKHPNIVQLVGYCSETEMKLVRHNGTFVRAEETERLLCLEYLQKGNLRGHLSDECSGLDWNTRYKIIEGICYGLHYLHEEWQVTPIIHMDLKPANILLDDNMVPKIADFGLSRLFGEEQTRTCTRSCKGTPGYMSPEYLEKGVITKMFDIFSLGVIIIEIITGLKDYPTDEIETTSHQYIDLVLNNWRHRLRKAQGYISQDIDYQQIQKCIQIGLLCVKFDPVKRPTISEIIKMLEGSHEAYQSESEAQLEELSKDAYRSITYHHHDYEMYNGQPRPINCSTLEESIIPGHKPTEPDVFPDQTIHEADEQGTSEVNRFSGTLSQQCTFERVGSVPVRTLSSVPENNETDVSFDIDVLMDSATGFQYEAPEANYTAGSVTLHCPTTASNEIIASVALDQTVLGIHQEDYTSLTNNGVSLGHWYPEQPMVSLYASPFPLSMQAGDPVLSTQSSFNMDEFFKDLPHDKPQFCAPIVSKLPTDVGSSMTKLPACRRWVKLSALVKWKAIMRASKRARLMFEQESWSP